MIITLCSAILLNSCGGSGNPTAASSGSLASSAQSSAPTGLPAGYVIQASRTLSGVTSQSLTLGEMGWCDLTGDSAYKWSSLSTQRVQIYLVQDTLLYLADDTTPLSQISTLGQQFTRIDSTQGLFGVWSSTGKAITEQTSLEWFTTDSAFILASTLSLDTVLNLYIGSGSTAQKVSYNTLTTPFLGSTFTEKFTEVFDKGRYTAVERLITYNGKTCSATLARPLMIHSSAECQAAWNSVVAFRACQATLASGYSKLDFCTTNKARSTSCVNLQPLN